MANAEDEERRAELWRREHAKGEAARHHRAERLHGNPAARQRLQERWQPLIDYLVCDAPDDDEGV